MIFLNSHALNSRYGYNLPLLEEKIAVNLMAGEAGPEGWKKKIRNVFDSAQPFSKEEGKGREEVERRRVGDADHVQQDRDQHQYGLYVRNNCKPGTLGVLSVRRMQATLE